RQSRKPGGLLSLVVELKSILRAVFRPIARVRHRDRMLDETVAARVPAFAALVPFFGNLAWLSRQGLRGGILEHDAERVLIVDRHPGMPAEIRKRGQRRDKRIKRQKELVDTPVQGICIVVSPGGDAHSEVLPDAFKSRTKIALLNPCAGRPLGIEA